jgi:FtsZ-binding cell division protein ZapB
VNKLKAQLAKGCPTLNIDSLYNEFPLDTIYIDHYHTKTVTQKDTTGNYFRQLNEDALRSDNNTLNAENVSLNKHIEDITKDLNEVKKTKDKWKLYFFLLLTSGIAYKVAKIYLSKSFTLPKIF